MPRRYPILIFLFVLLIVAAPFAGADQTQQVLSPNAVTCRSAILMDFDTGDVLYTKDSAAKVYPASTTKIMTLLLALESGIDPDTIVTIPDAANTVPKDSTLVPVRPGEKMTFRDLMYGFMLPSGNDGAISIAVIVSGSEKAFVEKMNSRAAQIGCTGTHFANSHGYHNDNHFTTARDIALITREAMKNEMFRDIVQSREYTMEITPRGSVTVLNTNEIIQPSSQYYYKDAIGVKTGFTSKAGGCLVGAAERNGITLISVALYSSDKNTRFSDSVKMLDYGFSCYTPYTFADMYRLATGSFTQVKIANAIKTDTMGGMLPLELASTSSDEVIRLIYDGQPGNVTKAADEFSRTATVSITHDLTAPVYKGEVIGTITYPLGDGRTVSGLMVASRDVEQEPEKLTILKVLPFLSVFTQPYVLLLTALIALVALLCIISGARRRRRRARQRKQIYEKRKKSMQQRGRARSSKGR